MPLRTKGDPVGTLAIPDESTGTVALTCPEAKRSIRQTIVIVRLRCFILNAPPHKKRRLFLLPYTNTNYTLFWCKSQSLSLFFIPLNPVKSSRSTVIIGYLKMLYVDGCFARRYD
jgi:hypothetical protein